ncbi:peptidoglycan-binding domain-containing protein [Acetivibrio straminisolvens]|jgi:peptidoglycan hydrolase-like protein with peptidoglycan-binding domain|uniref:peptidoglycan-binding domain-containing protein n=1 Tax=Acetivibrio straminisolvens TaxID=253314 RepID=UPI00223F04E3|nr:peptidoglycan-binding protein [Acetivibrio straminisolvens]
MQKKKPALFSVILPFLIACIMINSSIVFASSGVLKEGMSGSQVTALQKDLNTLGYLDVSPTGYYGSLTTAAVKKLQKNHGLKDDGIAGPNTFSLIKKLINERTASRSSGSTALKEGMSGSSVTALQKDLKALGYLNVEPTGYYGSLTKEAVKKLQAKHGLQQDGIAGTNTLALIDRLMGRSGSSASQLSTAATRGGIEKNNYLYSWFGNAENIFKKGDTAQVYDIKTGRTFNIKRTYGYNHADCETLTAKDTEIMLSIYGGSWSWERRPIIITVNGRKMAASMAGMPHAGVDSAPAEAYVKSRSGGYGAGDNLDAVKNNNMNGVFDIHFLNSKTHGTNKVDSNHQKAVKEAAEWASKNNF